MTSSSEERPERRILLGRVAGAFGVRGEAKLESWTEPRSAIFRYQPWILRDPQGNERELRGVRGKESGKSVVATFPGIDDRDAVEALRGTEIYVPRSALPPPRPGEYYWVDLEGLRVVTVDGVPLGTVSHLFATGANDVLVARDHEYIGAERREFLQHPMHAGQGLDGDLRAVVVKEPRIGRRRMCGKHDVAVRRAAEAVFSWLKPEQPCQRKPTLVAKKVLLAAAAELQHFGFGVCSLLQ